MSEVKTSSRIVDDLSEILSKKEYSDVIDALTPKMSLPFDFTAPEFVELYKQDKGNFFKYVREAIMQRLELRCVGFDARTAFAGLKIEPQGQPAISMQDINPRDNESNIVCFDCQVIAVDKRKSYIKSGTGSCDICGHSETVECDPDLKLKMPKCTVVDVVKH